jgi:hypothetical protein
MSGTSSKFANAQKCSDVEQFKLYHKLKENFSEI